MKNTSLFMVAFSALFLFLCCAQQTDSWTEKQLLPPAQLARMISDSSAKKLYIYSVRPSASIPGSIDIGQGRDKDNIEKLKQQVAKLPRNADVVIYCGCCPFKNCPNIRPALNLLNEMKFTNYKLLDLSQNFKTDWIDKGYPVKK